MLAHGLFMADTMTIDKDEFNRVRSAVQGLAVSQATTNAQMEKLSGIADKQNELLSEIVNQSKEMISQGKDIKHMKDDIAKIKSNQKEQDGKIDSNDKKLVKFGFAIALIVAALVATNPELQALLSLIK